MGAGSRSGRERIVLVCGGRDYTNYMQVNVTLRRLKPTKIINGAARGADRLSSMWAQANNVPYEEFEADWRNFGSAAGPIRNSQMLRAANPDLVVAFRGGTGTRDMVAKARAAGVEVELVDWLVDPP
jgi:ABC-type Fe3+-hydroxamate transport system substrate-binding protein